jgi:Helix-turn-helix domain
MTTTAAGAAHLSAADLAAREGVPLATVYSWNYTGTGPPYFRAGRHVRYRLADVERWEREQEVARDARSA